MKFLFVSIFSLMCISCDRHEKCYKSAVAEIAIIKSNPDDHAAWSRLISKYNCLEGNAGYTEFVLIELSELTKKGIVTQISIGRIGNLTKEDRDTVQSMYRMSLSSP